MSRNRQILDFEPENDYLLIGIHCQWEAYRVAYLLNHHLKLRLKREKSDIDFQHKNLLAFYPVYRYYEEDNCCDYYLAANKFRGMPSEVQPQGSLFRSEAMLTTNLVPEHKNVDFLLKVEDQNEIVEPKSLASMINAIPEIRIAYKINIETLKSRENLIFN